MHICITWGGISYNGQDKVYSFENNTHYEIELGAISLKNGSGVWTYIKVNDVLVGTAIRLSNTADDSGIRFSTLINTEDMNALNSYATIEYGTLIKPNDYLSDGQARQKCKKAMRQHTYMRTKNINLRKE